jgi:hypothetical protein
MPGKSLNKFVFARRAFGTKCPHDDGSFYKAMIEIAQKKLDKNGLAVVLR